jgi:hypothetical protein
MIVWIVYFFWKKPLLKKYNYKRDPKDRRYWKGNVVISKDINGQDIYASVSHDHVINIPFSYLRNHITHPAYHHFEYWKSVALDGG